MYSIKATAELTGLGTETLRAWERRYEGISPARSDNGRRLYSQQELEKLMLLAQLTRSGHAISKIASLDCEALRSLQHQSQGLQQHRESVLVEQIIEALLDYRIDRCETLLKRALLASEPLEYVRDILLPTLQKIGDLWHLEKLNIAQEHMFTCCVKRIVLSMVNNLHSNSASSPTMLLATPSDEPHEFGILLSSLLAAHLQYRCFYLGADLPGTDIVDAIRHLQPEIVVIGLVKAPPERETLEQLNVIVTDEVLQASSIWLGGSGASYCQQVLSFSNCEVLTDIEHFYNKAKQWQMRR
jgi:DNA-binding transcriptional MerR regulator